MSKERVTLVATMQVTEPQALALQAMFNHWNRLASWGSSRFVGFYVDGDGDFKPRVCVAIHAGHDKVRYLTEDLEKLAMIATDDDPHGIRFDYDPIGWKLSDERRERELQFLRAKIQSAEQMARSEDGTEQNAPEGMGEAPPS